MSEELQHISETALTGLRSAIKANLSRYRGDGFADIASEPSWGIGLKIDYDRELLSSLDLTQQQNIVEIDLKNSRIVGAALSNLTPSLANEELIWVRLSHVEGFEYSKARWIAGISDDGALMSSIEAHLFAPTQTAIRDDHALSRLWWNHQIAKTSMPDDIDRALGLILKTADIRSNFVERIWMSSRRQIAGAILRAMESRPEIVSAEDRFRAFMKVINRQGGGMVFEVFSEAEADLFVSECCDRVAKMVKAA